MYSFKVINKMPDASYRKLREKHDSLKAENKKLKKEIHKLKKENA